LLITFLELTTPSWFCQSHPFPFLDRRSRKAERFESKDVDAVLSAIEEAKKLPAPEGEEPGQFYYRKAMELLSQKKGKKITFPPLAALLRLFCALTDPL